MKLCECGCGLPAPISDRTRPHYGYIKGEPRRFVKGHYKPPRASSYHRKSVVGRGAGQVFEHVLIAEAALGRLLPVGVEVHHVDENPANNARGNLVICQSKAYHKLLHYRAKVVRRGGNPNTEKVCGDCGEVKPLGAFNVYRQDQSSGRQPVCRACQKVRFKRWTSEA